MFSGVPVVMFSAPGRKDLVRHKNFVDNALEFGVWGRSWLCGGNARCVGLSFLGPGSVVVRIIR